MSLNVNSAVSFGRRYLLTISSRATRRISISFRKPSSVPDMDTPFPPFLLLFQFTRLDAGAH